MKNIQVDLKNALPFINQDNYDKQINDQVKKLENKTGKGSDFIGWLDLPKNISKELIADINSTAKKLREISEIIIVIGIGGSYLGSKSVIEALTGQFDHLKLDKKSPQILFAGHNLSEDFHYELLEFLKNKATREVIHL